ncbi:tyrosine-type recombinase/integrase [Chloroflexota bacterium]
MKTYLDIQDVEKIICCANSIRDRLLIRLLFHLGCRASEVLDITLDDIDFEQKTIKILHLKTRSIVLCPSCKTRLARKHRFCPELALSRLGLAELLLDHYPDEKAEALEHLDFAIKEFREMKMQPSLERALRRKDILKA